MVADIFFLPEIYMQYYIRSLLVADVPFPYEVLPVHWDSLSNMHLRYDANKDDYNGDALPVYFAIILINARGLFCFVTAPRTMGHPKK